MKKKIVPVFTLIASALLAFSLISCGKKDTTIAHRHVYGDTYQMDSDNHWHACECGDTDSKVAHTYGAETILKEATNTTDGLKQKTCTACGYIKQEVIPKPEHIHEYTTYQNDDNSHWQVCSCGAASAHIAHTYGEYTTIKEPSFTEKGLKKRTCTACGHEDSLEIDKHNASEALIISNDKVSVDGVNASLTVSNSTESCDLSAILEVSYGATYKIYNDIAKTSEVSNKTVSLVVGINEYYIEVVSNDTTTTNTYKLEVKRNNLYEITIDDNVSVPTKRNVEENDTISLEDPIKPGYTFTGWMIDGALVSLPYKVTKPVTITASYTANTNTSYTVYHYQQNIYDDGYTLVKTDNLTGTTDTDTNAELYSVKGFVDSTISQENISGDGSTEIRLYYDRYNYTISIDGNSKARGLSVSNIGTYRYGTRITITADTSKLLLGYEFVGFDGNGSLTKTFDVTESEFLFLTKVDADIEAFNFTSTATTCTIKSVIDKSSTSLVIPNYVTDINAGALSGCVALESLTLPFVGDKKYDGGTAVKGLGYMFGTTSYSNSYSINQHNAKEGSESTIYYIPSSLKSVNITNEVSLTPYAFEECKSLTSITLPSGLTTIGRASFQHCEGIKSISIPSTVTTIGDYAFVFCTSLESITVPAGVKKIQQGCFSQCYKLTSINLPGSVELIEMFAFNGCTSLKEVSLPYGVKTLSTLIFDGCTSLKSITIPNSVEFINSSALQGCPALESLTLPFIGDDRVEAKTTCMFPLGFMLGGSGEKYSATTQYYYMSSTSSKVSETYYIPKSLKYITITDSTYIPDYAFQNCSNLVKVTINGAVTIGEYAFDHCGLTEVVLGEGLNEIGNLAFADCSNLQKVSMPNSIMTVGLDTFYHDTNIEYTEYSGGYYLGNSGNPYLYLDHTASKDIRTLTINENCKVLGPIAFRYCSKLITLTIPKNVVSIQIPTFNGCNRIFEVINFSSLSIAKGNASNGGVAFRALSVKNSGTSDIVDVGDYSFLTVNGINYLVDYHGTDTDITLPTDYNGSSYQLAWQALHSFTNLTSIVIPASITSLSESCFNSCTSLVSVTIPAGVTNISAFVFSGCSSLANINYGGTKEEWNAITFGAFWNSNSGAYTIHCSDGDIAKA